jgi:hypothetical protein
MDFSYSEEQRMLTDSLRRVIADHWSFAQRRERQRAGVMDTGCWRNLAGLGVAGLLVPQEYGGFGETPATMLAVHRELGRGLVSEPVIPSAVMAVTLLAHCQNQTLKAQWLAAHAEGDAVLALAWQEEGERYATRALCTRVESADGGLRLDGRKILVWHAQSAQAIIVSALIDGDMALVLVPRDTPGLTIADYPTFDGARAATLTFEGVRLEPGQLIARGAEAHALLTLALDYGVTALCAHACGAMEALTETTIQYLKTRKQFGQPLANFQVLQHRLADMVIQQEMALSVTYVAVVGLGEEDVARRSRLVSMSKVEVATAARFVGESAVQLHGGMGVTDELEVGDFFKRLTYADILLGDTNFHLQRMQDVGN